MSSEVPLKLYHASRLRDGKQHLMASVIMMETTDLWNGPHFAHRRRLYAARLGRVFLKRQMSPARMIVVDVFA